MDVTGKSHSSIVPKRASEQGQGATACGAGGGRELTKENTEQSLLDRTQSRNSDGDRS